MSRWLFQLKGGVILLGTSIVSPAPCGVGDERLRVETNRAGGWRESWRGPDVRVGSGRVPAGYFDANT